MLIQITEKCHSETIANKPCFIGCITTISSGSEVFNDHLEKYCRICLEGESSNDKTSNNDSLAFGKLICPCSCKGSIAFIHERCLKKQIICGVTKLKSAPRCEICLQTYQMDVRVEQNFRFRNLPSAETKWIYMLIFLSVVLLIALYKTCQLFLKIMTTPSYSTGITHKEGKGHPESVSIRLLSWLWITSVVLFAFIVSIIKNHFIFSHVRWEILNRQEHQKEAAAEQFSRLKEILDGDESFEDIDALTELPIVSA